MLLQQPDPVVYIYEISEVSMEYREFEQHVADYVEGGLDSELRRRMDAARASNPACERLARLHEQLLAEIKNAQEIQAPEGLAEKIILRAENLEQLLAAQQKAFRRGVWLGVAGAAIGATALAALLFMFDLTAGTGALNAAANAWNAWIAQLSYKLYGWFGAADAFMKSEIVLPVIGSSTPVYILILSAVVTAFLAWLREEIMEALDSL